jgi:hypothetical protein
MSTSGTKIQKLSLLTGLKQEIPGFAQNDRRLVS